MNDWDLAVVVGLSEHDGSDRTGTVPFMALDLLTDEYWDGKIARLYRHDIEGMIWILPWVFLRFKDGKEVERAPLGEWRMGDYNVCRKEKTDFLLNFQKPNFIQTVSYSAEWQLARTLLTWVRAETFSRANAVIENRAVQEPEPETTYAMFWSKVKAAGMGNNELGYLMTVIPPAFR